MKHRPSDPSSPPDPRRATASGHQSGHQAQPREHHSRGRRRGPWLTNHATRAMNEGGAPCGPVANVCLVRGGPSRGGANSGAAITARPSTDPGPTGSDSESKHKPALHRNRCCYLISKLMRPEPVGSLYSSEPSFAHVGAKGRFTVALTTTDFCFVVRSYM